MAAREYACAICGRTVTHDGPPPSVYPFCSPRCKLVDLGKWFREQYAIDRDAAPEELPPAGSPDASS
jgi:uncharacterized protein